LQILPRSQHWLRFVQWIALEIGHAVRHSTFAAGAIMFLTIITAGISALYNAVARTREHWQVVRT
jgi:hypothetical protein